MTFKILSITVIKVFKRWITHVNSIQYWYDDTHEPLWKLDQLFNLLLKRKSLIEMPSTRKQKAREKRSRQSDVMSDIENLDVRLGNYQENEQFREGDVTEGEIDLGSERRQRNTVPVESNYGSLLNTNLSEKSEITVETSRAINSEISSKMSRKLEEMKSDLNSHILEAINSAIERKYYRALKTWLRAIGKLKVQNGTFGQMNGIRVGIFRWFRIWTMSHIYGIKLNLANKSRTRRITFLN